MVKKLCVVIILVVMALALKPTEIAAIPKVIRIGTIQGLEYNLLLPAVQAAREAARVRTSGTGIGNIIGDWDGDGVLDEKKVINIQQDFDLVISPIFGGPGDDCVVKGRSRGFLEIGSRRISFSGKIDGAGTYDENGCNVEMTFVCNKGQNHRFLILNLRGFFDIFPEIDIPPSLIGGGTLSFKVEKGE